MKAPRARDILHREIEFLIVLRHKGMVELQTFDWATRITLYAQLAMLEGVIMHLTKAAATTARSRIRRRIASSPS